MIRVFRAVIVTDDGTTPEWLEGFIISAFEKENGYPPALVQVDEVEIHDEDQS